LSADQNCVCHKLFEFSAAAQQRRPTNDNKNPRT
jgi:hypothetical protein